MKLESKEGLNIKIGALLSILLLNAFIFNPWTKFPYTFVVIIAAALLISFFQFRSLSELGFKTNYSFKKILLTSLMIFLIVEPFVDFVLQPFTNWVTNSPPDYSGFDIVKGKTDLFLRYLLFIWISAAFGEEILFRGFLFQQLKIIIPEIKYKLVLIALVSSMLFAIPHLYLGWSGVLFTFFFGIIFSIIYIKYDYNLWIPIIVHGLVDSLFITLAYTDNMDYYQWVNQLVSVY